MDLPPVVHASAHAEPRQLDGGLGKRVVVHDLVLVHNLHGEVVANVLDVVSKGLAELGFFAAVPGHLALKLLHTVLNLHVGVLSAKGFCVARKAGLYNRNVQFA